MPGGDATWANSKYDTLCREVRTASDQTKRSRAHELEDASAEGMASKQECVPGLEDCLNDATSMAKGAKADVQVNSVSSPCNACARARLMSRLSAKSSKGTSFGT
eukprot:2287726-Amphidinium_carterae.1